MAVNIGELQGVLTLKDELSGTLKQTQGRMTSVLGTAAKFAAAGTAIYSAFKLVGGALTAQSTQLEAVNKMNIALANQGNLLAGTSQRLQEYASEMQKVTKYGDEEVIDLQARLAGYGMAEEQIKATTKATLDMASATGVDLRAAADLMGKAFAGETSMLSRYGIMIDKNLPKSEKFAAAMEQVSTRFGGQAAAAAETFTGRMTQLGNALGDTMEALGKLFMALGSEGPDVFATVIGWIEGLTKFIGQDLVLAVGEARARFAEMIAGLMTGTSKLFGFLAKIPKVGDFFKEQAETMEYAAGRQRDLAKEVRETSQAQALSVGTTKEVSNGVKRAAVDTEALAKQQKELAAMTKEADAKLKEELATLNSLSDVDLPPFFDPKITPRMTAALDKLGDSTFDVREAATGLAEGISYVYGGVDRLNDTQLGNAIAEMERLAESGDLTAKQWEFLGELYTELGSRPHLKKLQDDVDTATSKTDYFQIALENAANTAQLLGDTGLGGLIGDLLAGASAGLAFAENLRNAMTEAGGFSKMNFSQKAGAVGGMAQGAIGIWNQNKNNLSGANAAMSGAASGAAMGSAFGPIGAGVGAIAGGLIGFFSGRKFRKIASDAGKILGGELSSETVEAIQASMDEFDLSAADAALLHLVDGAHDTGQSIEDMTEQVNDLIAGVADGTLPAAEGVAELGEAWNEMAEKAEAAGDLASDGMLNMIEQTRAAGVEVAEVAQYIEASLEKAVGGVQKFVHALAFVSDDALPELGANAGIIFGATFDALVSEHGLVGAVDMLGDSFLELQETLIETLGPEAANAIVGPFAQAFVTLQDESLRPIFDGIQGITEAMTGLFNAGYLNVDAFNAMQAASVDLFNAALDGGADLNVSLAAIAPDIQAAVDAAQRFGVPLSDDMQALKELAEQNGYTFATDPMDAMLDVLVSIAEVLGAEIPAAAQRAGQAIGDIPKPPSVPDYGGSPGAPPGGPGGRPFADGGIVTGPTLGLVGEAGPEAIVPLDRADQVRGVGGGGDLEAAMSRQTKELAKAFRDAIMKAPIGG